MSPEMINGLYALGGAVLGAVVSGLFAARQARKPETRRELSVLTTRPSRLIAIDDRVADNVEVTVSGEAVPTVYLSDVTVVNSGTEVLSDVTVQLSFKGEGKLLMIGVRDASFEFTPNGYTIDKAGDLKATLKCKYLNAGDEVTLRVMLSGRPESWSTEFRQPGVTLIERADSEGASSARAFFEAARQNWVLNSYMTLMLPAYRRFLEEEDRAD